MGADLTKEYPSTWEQDDVKKWKEQALQILKSYYLNFAGCQWHEFDRRNDTALLRAKICFALFGLPSEDAVDIENAYSTEQRQKAGPILDSILKVKN